MSTNCFSQISCNLHKAKCTKLKFDTNPNDNSTHLLWRLRGPRSKKQNAYFTINPKLVNKIATAWNILAKTINITQ